MKKGIFYFRIKNDDSSFVISCEPTTKDDKTPVYSKEEYNDMSLALLFLTAEQMGIPFNSIDLSTEDEYSQYIESIDNDGLLGL